MQVSYRSTLYIIQRKVSKDKVKSTLSVMLGSRHLMEDRKLHWSKENDLFSFRKRREKRSTTTVHYRFLWLISIKVWNEIPVEENDKGLWVLIVSAKGREGWPFSQRDNEYYMTVNGMPWQGRRWGSGTETSLAGHQNECAFFVLLCFF